jgi:hypothetical protein
MYDVGNIITVKAWWRDDVPTVCVRPVGCSGAHRRWILKTTIINETGENIL